MEDDLLVRMPATLAVNFISTGLIRKQVYNNILTIVKVKNEKIRRRFNNILYRTTKLSLLYQSKMCFLAINRNNINIFLHPTHKDQIPNNCVYSNLKTPLIN